MDMQQERTQEQLLVETVSALLLFRILSACLLGVGSEQSRAVHAIGRAEHAVSSRTGCTVTLVEPAQVASSIGVC